MLERQQIPVPPLQFTKFAAVFVRFVNVTPIVVRLPRTGRPKRVRRRIRLGSVSDSEQDTLTTAVNAKQADNDRRLSFIGTRVNGVAGCS